MKAPFQAVAQVTGIQATGAAGEGAALFTPFKEGK